MRHESPPAPGPWSRVVFKLSLRQRGHRGKGEAGAGWGRAAKL